MATDPQKFKTLITVAFASGAIGLASCQTAAVSEKAVAIGVGRFECVARAATAEPPPVPAPTLRGERGGSRELREVRLAPVCPEGTVPVAPSFKMLVPKGNPLLGPAKIRPDFDPSTLRDKGEEIRKNLRKFEEVYGQKLHDERRPLPPDPAAGCGGIENHNACYYYASAADRRAADGDGMTFTIAAPAYDGTGGGGHSLDEIAVQGGTSDGDIVELGWRVSSDQGDTAPHLFVFHWIGWAPTCYNDGCGWQQWSTTYFPGMDLSALVGVPAYGGYVYWQGNWWAWFNNQWLGYFPGSKWGDRYSRNGLIQWYGEIATNNGIPPKSDMGNGQRPAVATAAAMSTLCDVDAAAWICWYRDQQSLYETQPAYYEIDRTDFGQARYGGPGE